MEAIKAEDILRIIKENGDKLPLGYQFLKQPIIGKGVVFTAHSSFHNSCQYPIRLFYKPVSSLDI
jgi:hypothetical protein